MCVRVCARIFASVSVSFNVCSFDSWAHTHTRRVVFVGPFIERDSLVLFSLQQQQQQQRWQEGTQRRAHCGNGGGGDINQCSPLMDFLQLVARGNQPILRRGACGVLSSVPWSLIVITTSSVAAARPHQLAKHTTVSSLHFGPFDYDVPPYGREDVKQCCEPSVRLSVCSVF